MKRIGIISLFLVALSFVSCNNVSKLTSSNSAATASGAACGQVLSGLYSQYKISGTVNMKNTSTLLNVVELGTYYKTLKENKDNSAYKKDFTVGLISGSNGLITNNNSVSALNSLLSLNELSNITSSTSSTSTSAISVTSGLVSLFKNLK